MESLILQTLPDPILLVGRDRKIVEANQAAHELFSHIALNQDIAITTRNPDIHDVVDKAFKGVKPETIHIDITHPVPRTFQLNTSLIRDPDASEAPPRLVVLLFHDITPIQTAERFRRDFIANVSHELRSPLVSLIGFIETLQTAARDDPEAREHFLNIMDMEAGRMKSLIDDLLSLSKIEANEHLRPSGTVRIIDVIEMVLEPLRKKAETRSINLTCDCQRDLPEILGSAEELIQVFNNLVDNAIKYGSEGTDVDIKVEQVDRIPNLGVRGLRISVHNWGDAISPEHLPRLTERFYRIDKGRSRAIGGTGLGLAIVKHMVNRHRGRLAIESSPQEGTTFSVYLPTI